MKPELLAPAGNIKCLESAIMCGADAVYLGLNKFNARAKAANFDFERLEYALSLCKLYGVKLYVTFNTFLKENELKEAKKLLDKLDNYAIDGIIIADLALFCLLKDKNIPIHISTQGGTLNKETALFYQELGAERVVLSREIQKADIIAIKKATNLTLEYFVHGALCSSFSGACTLSTLHTGGSGNRGNCAQPCRLKHDLYINDTKKEGFMLSTSDLCLLERLNELKALGIDAFKIEGRLKRSEYTAQTVLSYKRAIDGGYDLKKEKTDLLKIFNRGSFCGGFLFSDTKDIMSSRLQNHGGIKIGKVLRTFKKGGYPYAEVCSDVELSKGDGLKVLREGVEIGGAEVHSVDYLGNNKYVIPTSEGVRVSDILCLTTDKRQIDYLNSIKKKLGIDMIFCLKENNLSLKISYNGIAVDLASDFIPEASLKDTLNLDYIKEQLSKLGDTEFALNNLELDVEEGLFVPISKIKELRQKATTLLKQKIIQSSKPKSRINKPDFPTKKPQFNQSEPIIFKPDDYDFDLVKAGLDVYDGKRVYVALPKLFGEADAGLLGFLINEIKYRGFGIYANSIASVYLAKKHNLYFGVGNELNIMNTLAASILYDADFVIAATELSKTEIEPLTKIGIKAFCGKELPVMVLRHCPFKLFTNKACNECAYNPNLPVYYTDPRFNKLLIKRTKTLGGCYFDVYKKVGN